MIELETERLLLRRFRAEDLPRFVAYRRDPEVARWQAWDAEYSPEDAEAFLDDQAGAEIGEPGRWVQVAAVDKAEGTLVGDCAVCPVPGTPQTFEVGVTLTAQLQGQGLAREALMAVVAMLFAEYHAHRVIASVDDRNAAAIALVERLGFRHEGTFVEADRLKGEWATLRVYAMLAREAGTA